MIVNPPAMRVSSAKSRRAVGVEWLRCPCCDTLALDDWGVQDAVTVCWLCHEPLNTDPDLDVVPRGQVIGAANLHEVPPPNPGLIYNSDVRPPPFVVFEAFWNPGRDQANARRILAKHTTPWEPGDE